MITIDDKRGREAAKMLHSAFAEQGILGSKWMPEDVMPAGVEQGSLEHILFLTLTVAIDYQREAGALWGAARQAFADPTTRYLFEPKALHETPWQTVQTDLHRHRVSKKPGKDCNIWRTVGITFHKQWGGDPRNFLEACGWSAPAILERLRSGTHLNNGWQVLDFPYLRGKKIGPLWLRMLRDNARLEIKDLEAVPIAVDVHVARATLALGVVRGVYDGEVEGIYEEIRRAWRQSVKGLEVGGRAMVALDVDEPLWHLSKYGCTDRDQATSECSHYERCEAREFCVPGKVVVSQGRVLLHT